MKKLLLTISVSLVAVCFAFGQISQGEYQLGGTYADQGYSIIKTNDGGYAIAGGYGDDYSDSAYLYVIKLDSNFNFKWSKTIGGVGTEYGNSIIQSKDKGYIVVGYSSSYGAGSNDEYVVKLDSAGNVKWTRTSGGTGDDEATSVVQSANGDYVIAGYTNSFGAGGYDAYVTELDTAGNLVLSKTYGNGFDEKINSMSKTKDKGYILAGYTNSSGAGGQDVYLLKLDSVFHVTWSSTLGASNNEIANSVIQTKKGDFAIAGINDSAVGMGGYIQGYVALIDSIGNLKKAEDINSGIYNYKSEIFNAIAQTLDGGYTITGMSYSFSVGGTGSLYTVKVDTALNIIKGVALGGCEAEGQSLLQTSDKGILVVGQNCPVYPDSGNIFLVKYDSTLNTCGSLAYGGVAIASGILTRPLVFTGSGGTITSTNQGKISSAGGSSNVCSTPTSVNTISPPINSVQVYPNPGNGVFIIEQSAEKQSGVIEVYNILGEKIHQHSFSALLTTLDLSGQPSGIYFYRITSEKGEAINSGKLIIEK